MSDGERGGNKTGRKFPCIQYLSTLVRSTDPCTSHATLTEETKRSVAYVLSAGESPDCDSVLSANWYRIYSSAGNDTVTTCPSVDSCGTHFPVWMNGKPVLSCEQIRVSILDN